MNRPRPAVLLLVAGAIVLSAGAVGMARAGSDTQIESVGVRPTVDTAPIARTQTIAPLPSSRAPRPSPSREVSDDSPFRSLKRRDATDLPRPDRTPRPTQIRIPALDVSVAVDLVGLDDDGQVEVPYDVMRAGWYRFSARPGSGAGSTVIVGHVDGVDQGAGAFYGLRTLRPGDTVILTRADERSVTYEVVARELFAKDRVPLRELFARSGPERLTLITCGGPFDPSALEYTDNVVVTAVPVDSQDDLGKTR